MSAFLLPSRNSTSRYCADWKPELVARNGRISAYSEGVRVASTDHWSVSVCWMCLIRASRLSAGERSSVRSSARAERSSWIISLSHSSLVWCWTMKSSSSCCGGSRQRLLGRQQHVEAQVVAVGHRPREVPLDAFLEVALVRWSAGPGVTHGLQGSRWPRLPSSHGHPRRAHPHLGARLAVRARAGAAARSAAGRVTRPSGTRSPAASGAPCVRRWARRRCASTRGPAAGEVRGRAWGPGAEWALDRMPALLGRRRRPRPASRPTTTPRSPKAGAPTSTGASVAPGLVMESLVPSILEQKVTGKQAFGSFRELVRRHGEPAPGPVAALRLHAAADARDHRRDPVVGVAAARACSPPSRGPS